MLLVYCCTSCCLCLSWSLHWHSSLPKNGSQNQLTVETQASFHILFSTFGGEERVKKCQTRANNMTLFFCHRTKLILPSINKEIAFTGNSFLHNGYPVLSRAVETKRVSFPSRDNHRLHPPLDFAVLYSTWSREMKPRCIASGITLGLRVQHSKESWSAICDGGN